MLLLREDIGVKRHRDTGLLCNLLLCQTGVGTTYFQVLCNAVPQVIHIFIASTYSMEQLYMLSGTIGRIAPHMFLFLDRNAACSFDEKIF